MASLNEAMQLETPEKPVNLVEQLRRKSEAMKKAAAKGQEISAAEHKLLVDGFNSPFWAVLSREFKARKAILTSKLRTTPPTTDNLPAIYEFLAEINVWEFLIDLPRVELEQQR